MTIETKFDSNYRKVLVAARRARQIQSGSQALIPTHSTKACRIAQEEVEAGKIAYVKKDIPVVKPPVDKPITTNACGRRNGSASLRHSTAFTCAARIWPVSITNTNLAK